VTVLDTTREEVSPRNVGDCGTEGRKGGRNERKGEKEAQEVYPTWVHETFK
jgi:hypothetical protein